MSELPPTKEGARTEVAGDAPTQLEPTHRTPDESTVGLTASSQPTGAPARLAGDDSPPVLVSNAALTGSPIHVSPDGRTVAAERRLDPKDRAADSSVPFDAILILISLTDGTTSWIRSSSEGLRAAGAGKDISGLPSTSGPDQPVRAS